MTSRTYGGVTVAISGDTQLAESLKRLAAGFPAKAHAALVGEAEAVLPVLEANAPLGSPTAPHGGDKHAGRLRASAFVEEGTNDLIVGITMGGDAVPEALPQEVRTTYAHPQGGEAHYFAETFRAERPQFVGRMLDRLKGAAEDLAS